MLERIADEVWIADGPTVSFLKFPYPTRMAVVRLPSGALWVWSPIALDDALAREVEALGPVAHVVEPNKLHHLALPAWRARFPAARLYAPPGLARRTPSLRFDAELTDAAEPAFEGAIEHVIVHGSFAMDEVLFFHRASATIFVGDLVQKHDPKQFARWQRVFVKLDGMMGPNGSTPREWRASFLDRRAARSAVEHALGWRPERAVIAHGRWARHDGAAMLRDAFAWLKLAPSRA